MVQPTILIVGGTSGLGRKLAELYAAEGAIVGIVGRRKHLLEEISQSTNIKTFQLDISTPECSNRISNIIQDLGGIDTLILAASIVEFNPALELEIEEKTLAVNVNGFAAVVNAGYHYFLQKEEGHLVTITSIAAARGNKTAPAYNASKAFQASYTEGIRLKLLQWGKPIYVTEIVPGYIDTQMAKGDRLFWMAPLSKAALQTKKAIESKKQKAYVSKRWLLVYKVYQFLPGFLYTFLINSKIKLAEKR